MSGWNRADDGLKKWGAALRPLADLWDKIYPMPKALLTNLDFSESLLVGKSIEVSRFHDMQTGAIRHGCKFFGNRKIHMVNRVFSQFPLPPDFVERTGLPKAVAEAMAEVLCQDADKLEACKDALIQLVRIANPAWNSAAYFVEGSIRAGISIERASDLPYDDRLTDLLMLEHGVLSQKVGEKQLACWVLQEVITWEQIANPKLAAKEPVYIPADQAESIDGMFGAIWNKLF